MATPELTFGEHSKARQSIDDATPDEWGEAFKKVMKEAREKNDPVDSPAHYNAGQIETIDYIEDVLGEYETIFYCHGNVLKYLGSRLWNKNDPLEDAKKARWYLNRMIKLMENTKGWNW